MKRYSYSCTKSLAGHPSQSLPVLIALRGLLVVDNQHCDHQKQNSKKMLKIIMYVFGLMNTELFVGCLVVTSVVFAVIYFVVYYYIVQHKKILLRLREEVSIVTVDRSSGFTEGAGWTAGAV